MEDTTSSAGDSAIIIHRAAARSAHSGASEFFTGAVRVEPLFAPLAPSRLAGASVTFHPGAHTAWHRHPLGQTLIVTHGVGWVQSWGGPIEEIRRGDVVQIPAGHTDAPNLKKLLGDPKVTKIFHFARFDLAVLFHTLGVMPEPVYCTKIVSRLVRTYTDRHGLKDLVREVLGGELSKQQQTSDWGAENLSAEQMAEYLQRVGCEVTAIASPASPPCGGGGCEGSPPPTPLSDREGSMKETVLKVAVPTARWDVEREVDLIEEVIRVYGYDKVTTSRKIQIEAKPADARQKFSQAIGSFLAGCGYYETVNVTFVDRAVADLFSPEGATHLGVRDVTRKTGNLLRQTLLGSLLGVLKTNVNAKNLPCRIYEMADTFVPSGGKDSLPKERLKVSLVTDDDLRQLRGVVEGLIRNVNRTADVRFEPADCLWAQVGACIRVNGKEIGQAGVFSDAVREKFDFKDLTPCGAELDFEELMALRSGPIRIRPIPRFPAIDRDLSILVPEQTPWARVAEAVEQVSPDELEEVRFVDIYRGKGIAPGKKSVTLSLRFRDDFGTLTHEIVDGYQRTILESLGKAVNAELRTV